MANEFRIALIVDERLCHNECSLRKTESLGRGSPNPVVGVARKKQQWLDWSVHRGWGFAPLMIC